MLKHFIKISLRRLFIDKTFNFINLIGLIIGLSSVFLLSKYVGFHLTTDDFQKRKKNIYAIHQTLSGQEGIEDYTESTYNEVAPLSKDQFPEIIAMSRFHIAAEALVTTTGPNGKQLIRFNERSIVEVDPDFIKMFTFNFLKGDYQTALNEPNTMVLSASMAKKYFGENDPLGKTLTTTKSWGGKKKWTITGVFEDYPLKSKFRFDCLQSLAGKEFEATEYGWSYPHIKSYLLLESPDKTRVLSEKITSLINGIDAFESKNRSVVFHLIPLTDETNLTTNQKLLVLVGLVLLLITWVNYMNLTSAKSLTRGKEFGVRKVFGANKLQVIRQFQYEALLIYFIAALAVAAVVLSVYPLLFDLSGGQLLPIFEVSTPINLIFLLFLLVGSIISSTCPSFSVSASPIIGLLKNHKAGRSKSWGLRKILIVFQFTISLVMLIGITTIYLQMQFIRNWDVGIDIDQTLILRSPKDGWEEKLDRIRSFKNEVRNQSFTQSVTSSTTVPLWWPGSPTDYEIEGLQESVRLRRIGVDENYFECYDLDLVTGEPFRAGHIQSNRSVVLVNETAARKMGYANPGEALYKKIVNRKNNQEMQIIGVVRDYHHESLRREIKAHVFDFNPFRGFISIKLNRSVRSSFKSISGDIESIRNIWNEIYPDQAFDYYFLDERFGNLYEEERVFQQLFLAFTLISITVTFLGIFGLSMFMALRRKKEIGIRKVLGAKPVQILVLISNDFMKKAGLSLLIGTPLAYYLMTMWLANFSYHISFSFWILVLPGIVLSVLTITSLSFESLKMANTNPVNILRNE